MSGRCRVCKGPRRARTDVAAWLRQQAAEADAIAQTKDPVTGGGEYPRALGHMQFAVGLVAAELEGRCRACALLEHMKRESERMDAVNQQQHQPEDTNHGAAERNHHP